MLRPYRYLKWKIKHFLINYRLEKSGASIGWNVNIELGHNGHIKLEKGSRIGNGTIICCTNEGAKEIVSKFTVGSGSSINENCNIRASGGAISIGKKTMIAHNVSIIATNHLINTSSYMIDEHWDTTKNQIEIGDDVWIGCHSVILPGVKVGNGAVIGAGSVVTKNVGRNEIFVGNSSKLVKKRERFHE